MVCVKDSGHPCRRCVWRQTMRSSARWTTTRWPCTAATAARRP